jgi:cytochrome c-type biogenesis protein CcmE
MSNEKNNILLLIVLLIVFAIIFFLALMGLQSNEALFSIGIPVLYENWLIMILSVGSVIKIVYELYAAD